MNNLSLPDKTWLADVALDFVQQGQDAQTATEHEDVCFVKTLFRLVSEKNEEDLQKIVDCCSQDEWGDLCQTLHTYSQHSAVVTKQSRKRDKKRKDDKRREYARHYCSPGTPRVKGDSEYVLPAQRSTWKKFLKRKANHTVRRYKGGLPKGNAYRRLDKDLWYWW